MNASMVRKLGAVTFPAWTGERVYMRPFTKRGGLPAHLARWQPTVDQMLCFVETDGPIYLMIDQSEVMAGKSQRRPGVHVDGYWKPAIQAHGGKPPGHCGSWDDPAPSRWKKCDFSKAEGLILASDVAACRAFTGHWSGDIGEGGDCSGIDLAGLRPHLLEAQRAYAGNVGMLHESLPVKSDCCRTIVRLNVPDWTP